MVWFHLVRAIVVMIMRVIVEECTLCTLYNSLFRKVYCDSSVKFYLLSVSRACFKVLPRILCFNTMRYTFNMVTMMKEKVNTHFSFPLHLNMAPYSEEYLMGEKIDEG